MATELGQTPGAGRSLTTLDKRHAAHSERVRHRQVVQQLRFNEQRETMSFHSHRHILTATRDEHFVGRAREREMLAAALQAKSWPFAVLHVSGAGGMGKTTLLRDFQARAAVAGVTGLEIRARDIHPTVASIEQALAEAAAQSGFSDLPMRMSGAGGRWFIAVDDCQLLSPYENWLRTDWLPSLPSTCLVILICRHRPKLEWHRHGGWHGVISEMRLDGLSPSDVGEYLTRRRIDRSLSGRVADLTAGHPLTMAMLVDALVRRGPEALDDATLASIYRSVTEMLLDEAAGSVQRRALTVCVLAHNTTHELLSAVMGADADGMFEWLARQSWAEVGPAGLFPHEATRIALAAGLRWQDPAGYLQVSRSLAERDDCRVAERDAPMDAEHGRAEFERCVRLALRDYHSPSRLACSPLLERRFVRDACQARGTPPVAVLQDSMRSAIESLAGSPRTVHLHRALAVTYLQGVEKQEVAAGQLDLPYGTYRRQLRRGLAEVASMLWIAERNGGKHRTASL